MQFTSRSLLLFLSLLVFGNGANYADEPTDEGVQTRPPTNVSAAIKELTDYKVEITRYIKDMDTRLSDNDEETLRISFRRVGVPDSAMHYADLWSSQWLLGPWMSDYRNDYFDRHRSALADSIKHIQTRGDVTSHELAYLRNGMVVLRPRMSTVREALLECAVPNLAKRARALGDAIDVREQGWRLACRWDDYSCLVEEDYLRDEADVWDEQERDFYAKAKACYERANNATSVLAFVSINNMDTRQSQQETEKD